MFLGHAAWYYLWGNRNWKTCLKQQCRRNRYFGHQYDRSTDERNADEFYAELENEMLRKVNALGIGPQGFGGKTTALAVNIEAMPTHIAGLPVAVNINCHVTRHKSATI